MSLERIAAAVDARRDAMLEFLEQVVNMDSPSEDKDLADKLGDVLQARAELLGMGFEVDRQEIYADNRIGRLAPVDAGTSVPRVLMVGHFDTVYAAGTSAERPFRVDGPLAYGPGAVDMKAGLVMVIFALEALKDVGVAIPPITLIMNGDEEPGSPKSREAILREAPRHDLALILEPGRPGPAVTLARKGVGIFRMIVSGVEAHAGSEPEKGANAIVETAYKTANLHALNDFSVGTTVNPGVVTGGTRPYVVPGRCELVTDIRVPSLSEKARVLEALDRISREVHVPGTTTELTGGFHRPPMEPTERTREFAGVLQSVGKAMGYPLDIASSGGASDGNLTASVGVPTIDGMGAQGGRSHSPEEYVEVESLTKKGAVLAGFLAAMADGQLRSWSEA